MLEGQHGQLPVHHHLVEPLQFIVLLAKLAGLTGQGLLDLFALGDIQQQTKHGRLAAIVDTAPIELHLDVLVVVVQGREAGVDLAVFLFAALQLLSHPGAVFRTGEGVQGANFEQGSGRGVAEQAGKTWVDVTELTCWMM